ncbi:MAG: molybdopterin-dependent oxidoreductase [Chloroflexi bacterium]|nr:molybdopterin-dependent oxidoreductase [Chloroflexota bacterium]MBT7081649.1 molybdopterin-dependent oxidoreductase [Chloroflexota bacterium]MBT7289322.1 molybdopterin-dependent oxidoreductase [Chloroflexota bacterium]
MQPITISLNGREVSGKQGMTILELAREMGVDIPTLCDDPNLTPIGACRICLVENEQNGDLLASCVTPIETGMVISTQSERVIVHRKTIVKLMLASHPDSCLVCNKGNTCTLRRVATDVGVGMIEFERIADAVEIEQLNPFIERDLSKCVLCAKCIRADQELVVVGAIDYFNRGFDAKPATFGDVPLEQSECTFCGTCVAMCPTGAIMDRGRSYHGTASDEVETTCAYCGCGCSISLGLKGDRIIAITPSKKGGPNNGTLCVRGTCASDVIHSADRLTQPMLRQEEELAPASWLDAIEAAAEGFKRVKGLHGPEALAVISSSTCTNEENYLLQRFTRDVLGTNNIDSSARLHNAVNRAALASTIGIMGANSDLDGLEQSDVIIVVGADPDASAPIVSYAIKRAVKYCGAKLILIDPRETGLSTFADIHIRPDYGTDAALLGGMAKAIVDEGLLDEKTVVEKTNNYDGLKASLSKYTAGSAAIEAAHLYAKANSASIVWGTGLTQHAGGADSVRALINLAILTNQTSGLYALEKECNDRGAFTEPLQGFSALEMIEQIEKGAIKSMLIVGENPILAFPDSGRVEKALSLLECLVVSDMFLTETALIADVVLSSSSFAEKEGTYTNFEGRVGKLNTAIDPIAGSLPDWNIILKLAEAMGSPMPFDDINQVSDEITALVGNESKSGPASFAPVDYVAPSDDTNKEYPFKLLTVSDLYSLGSGTSISHSYRLNKYTSEVYVEIAEEDASKLDIKDGDQVKIATPVGELTAIAKVSDSIPTGTIAIPQTLPTGSANVLFDITLDNETKTSLAKTCNVSLEKVVSNG